MTRVRNAQPTSHRNKETEKGAILRLFLIFFSFHLAALLVRVGILSLAAASAGAGTAAVNSPTKFAGNNPSKEEEEEEEEGKSAGLLNLPFPFPCIPFSFFLKNLFCR